MVVGNEGTGRTRALLGVVFVHGIRSSPTMWDPFADLIKQDQELAALVREPLPRFGYATGLWTWHPTRTLPSLDTAADSLKEYLVTEACEFDALVLVGHSQGGLIIERMLVQMLSEGRGRELARIRRVILLACPNTGSQLLLSARRGLLRRNPQERVLRPFDEQLASTRRTLMRDIVYATSRGERTWPIPFSVYAGESDGVVSPASARDAFPDAAALPGNHTTIARPDTHEHRTYSTVRRLLLSAADGDPPKESVRALGARLLEVQVAPYGDDHDQRDRSLTPYLTREHDHQLRDALAPALAGGPSRLVVLTGESSTGKTRSLYEALFALAPDRPLLRPTTCQDLIALLETAALGKGAILWLNEMQRFFSPAHGERAAAGLREVLERSNGVAVLGTLWTHPYWTELTALGQPGDPYSQARALLTHPAFARRIDVPTYLSKEGLAGWRELTRSTKDRRLKDAVKAAGSDGRVIQQLSGGPDLLAAYRRGPGSHFTHREHALVTAALDARRLGHRSALPGDLLSAAADGTLDAGHRSEDPRWARNDLHALSKGHRRDGSRTDVRHALTALEAARPFAGAPPVYDPAEYLHAHIDYLRADQIGSPALWEALIAYTVDGDDLLRIANQAWSRGFRVIAARLWKKAAALGHPIDQAVALGPTLDPGRQAAALAVAHADLSKGGQLSKLFKALQDAGDDVLVTQLARRAADHVDPRNPQAAGRLLFTLKEIGAIDLAEALCDNAAEHADSTDPAAMGILLAAVTTFSIEEVRYVLAKRGTLHQKTASQEEVSEYLRAYRERRTGHAVEVLCQRASGRVELRDPRALHQLIVSMRGWEPGAQAVKDLLRRGLATHVEVTDVPSLRTLMRVLRDAEAHDAVAVLAMRAAEHVESTDPRKVLALLNTFSEARADKAAMVLLQRGPTAHVHLGNPGAVGDLLAHLHGIGASDAVTTLLERDPAAHAELTSSYGTTRLILALRGAAATHMAEALTHRAIRDVDLGNPGAVGDLLAHLHGIGASDAVTTLLERDPAAHAELTEPAAIVTLLKALRECADAHATATLLARDPAAHTDPSHPHSVAQLLSELRSLGALEAARKLGARAAAHARLADVSITELQRELDSIDATSAAIFRARAANAGYFPERFAPYGRGPDGQPSLPWNWADT